MERLDNVNQREISQGMILYLESQLEACYRVYCLKQVKNDMPFMALEDFRSMFEGMMEVIYEEECD